jgi:hypothetical protein
MVTPRDIDRIRRELAEVQERCARAIRANNKAAMRDALADMAAIAAMGIPMLLKELERYLTPVARA